MFSSSVSRSGVHRDYFMESARVRDFHTSWCSIWNRTSERSERVRFLILDQRVWKSRAKRFPCCNLFISCILRFSRPQIYILALDKFELRTTRVNRKYYLILSKLPDKGTRDDRENTIRLSSGLWLDETIFSCVRNSFRLSDRSK